MPRRSGKRDDAPNEKFEALRQFFSGYLHEDFRDEYGSPMEAAKAFCADASPEDLAALRADWKKWWAASQRLGLAEIQRSVRELGSAWLPQNTEEVDAIGNTFAKAFSHK